MHRSRYLVAATGIAALAGLLGPERAAEQRLARRSEARVAVEGLDATPVARRVARPAHRAPRRGEATRRPAPLDRALAAFRRARSAPACQRLLGLIIAADLSGERAPDGMLEPAFVAMAAERGAPARQRAVARYLLRLAQRRGLLRESREALSRLVTHGAAAEIRAASLWIVAVGSPLADREPRLLRALERDPVAMVRATAAEGLRALLENERLSDVAQERVLLRLEREPSSAVRRELASALRVRVDHRPAWVLHRVGQAAERAQDPVVGRELLALLFEQWGQGARSWFARLEQHPRLGGEARLYMGLAVNR